MYTMIVKHGVFAFREKFDAKWHDHFCAIGDLFAAVDDVVNNVVHHGQTITFHSGKEIEPKPYETMITLLSEGCMMSPEGYKRHRKTTGLPKLTNEVI